MEESEGGRNRDFKVHDFHPRDIISNGNSKYLAREEDLPKGPIE
jgi:hypothetical protein